MLTWSCSLFTCNETFCMTVPERAGANGRCRRPHPEADEITNRAPFDDANVPIAVRGTMRLIVYLDEDGLRDGSPSAQIARRLNVAPATVGVWVERIRAYVDNPAGRMRAPSPGCLRH
jgi:hypothetical protein